MCKKEVKRVLGISAGGRFNIKIVYPRHTWLPLNAAPQFLTCFPCHGFRGKLDIVDPGQLASTKPIDLNLHCFLGRIYPVRYGEGQTVLFEHGNLFSL